MRHSVVYTTREFLSFVSCIHYCTRVQALELRIHTHTITHCNLTQFAVHKSCFITHNEGICSHVCYAVSGCFKKQNLLLLHTTYDYSQFTLTSRSFQPIIRLQVFTGNPKLPYQSTSSIIPFLRHGPFPLSPPYYIPPSLNHPACLR